MSELKNPQTAEAACNEQAMAMADANTVLVVVDVNKPSRTQCPELLKTCRSME